MAQEKAAHSSIAQTLQDDTIVSEESIAVFQEDIRIAEKERLQGEQNRRNLLESLRNSVNKVSSSLNQRAAIRQEFVRVIRDGVALEVEVVTKQVQKEIHALKTKGSLSAKADQAAKIFSGQAKMFVEKKKLLENIERKLEANRDGRDNDQELLFAKLANLSLSLRNELVRFMEDLLSVYGEMEDRIQNDLQEEENSRTFFNACISCLDEQKKWNVIKMYKTKSENASIGKRILLYKSFTEQLAKNDRNVAYKIHGLSRKKARDLLKQGRYVQAVAELCYAINLWKDDPDTYRLLANAFFRQKDEPKAYIALREVLRLCPEDISLRKRIADHWYKIGERKQAIGEYQEIVARSPGDYPARRELGKLLFEDRSYVQVPVILDEYVRHFPANAECLKWLGLSWSYTGNWKRTVPYLKKVIEIDPEDINTVQFLALAYRKLGLHDESVRLLEERLLTSPDAVSLLVSLGSIFPYFRLMSDRPMWIKETSLMFATLYNRHGLRMGRDNIQFAAGSSIKRSLSGSHLNLRPNNMDI